MNPKSLNRWRTFFSILLIASFVLGNLSLPTGKVYAQDAQTPTVEPSETETPTNEPTVEPTLEEPVVSETPSETETPTFTETPVLTEEPVFVPTKNFDSSVSSSPSSWQMTFNYSLGGDLTNEMVAGILDSITAMDVKIDNTQISDNDYRLNLVGANGLDQVKDVIYNKLLPKLNFLAGTAIVQISQQTVAGDLFEVYLESQAGTGYEWKLLSSEDDNVIEVSPSTFEDRYEGPGTTAKQKLTLKSSITGTSVYQLIYSRSFGQTDPATRTLAISIGEGQTSIDLSDPTPVLTGTKLNDLLDHLKPLDSEMSAQEVSAQTYPSSWDWRGFNKVTAIRDQKTCGSCWSFATTGIMESSLKIFKNVTEDFSEQFLLSCNVASQNGSGKKYDCTGGTFDALDYYIDELGQGQTVVGPVRESQFGYTANANTTCPTTLTHYSQYNATDWGGISNPTVAQVKWLVSSYGPVAIGICAGTAFNDYSGGVFSTDEGTCQNHMVNIVGWDDSTGTWIIKNSWGTSWGDNGFMKMKYGISGNQTVAVVVMMSGVPEVPELGSPIGTITTATPIYYWSESEGATSYTLKVVNASTSATVFTQSVPSSACNTDGTCSYQSATSLANGTNYSFYVSATNGSGTSVFGGPQNFYTNFSSATPTKTSTSVPPTATPTKTATSVPPTATPTKTATPSIPAATTVVYPVGDINTTSVVLQWKGVAGATYYVFKITNTDTGGTSTYTLGSSCTSGTCTSGTNTFGMSGTHYQITVAAKNDSGESAPSTPVTFRVLPNLLDTPTISAPTGAISYNAPTYAWASSTGATMYSGKVFEGSSSTATFSFDTTPASSCSGSSCSYFAMMGLTSNKSYRFTMQATDGSKYSDIATASFTISTPPPVPTLIGPSGEISADTPTFQWNASTGAVSYNLVVTNTDGGSEVVNTVVTSSVCISAVCSVTSPVTLVGNNYQFKVSASNGLVSSAFSTPVAFYYTTHIPPAIPVMDGPSGGITADKPTFTWAKVSGAANYYLKVTDTDASSVALTAYVSSSACDASLCTYVATTSLLGQNYQAEVYASNFYGKSDYSDPLPFYYTNHIPPEAPTLVGPSGETNTDTPTYQWNAISGATKYHLLVTDLDDDSTVVNQDVTTSSCTASICSYKPSSVTLLGQNYEFAVKASNIFGDGEYATPMGFNYTYHVAPDVAETTSPEGAITIEKPTFKWNAVSNASSYQLVVTLNDSATTVLDQAVTSNACISGVCSFVAPNTLSGYDYSFKVASKNIYGQSEFSIDRQFWISTHVLPLVPSVIGPEGEVNVDQPTYQWNTAEGATSYLLRVTETNTDTVAINGVSVSTAYCSGSTCSYKPATTLYGQNYKVEVAARNAVGTSAYSEPVTFYYTTHIPPSAPSMSAPAGKIAIEKPTYKWLPTSGATGYKLKVVNVDGETPVSTVSVDVATSYCTASLCSYTPATTLTGVNYQASVAAKNIYGFGDDSSPVEFTIAIHTTPDVPVLSSPSGETNTDTPTYQWLPVIGATSYTLTVTDVDKATNPVNNISVASSFCSATLCSYKPGTTLTGQNYQFTVVAKNTSGSTSSEAMSFYYSTHVAPATPETLVAPEGNIYVEQPTYQWNSVSNATSYQLQVTDTDTSLVVVDTSVSGSNCSVGVCSYKPLITLTGLNYSFAVKAVNAYGNSDYSTPMAFIVATHQPPEAPILVSPSGDVSDETPTYTWEVSQGATSYEIKVTRLDDNAVVLDQSVGITACGTTTCSITPLNSLMGHEYQFEVKAKNTYGESDYSDSLAFTYPSHIPPSAPTLIGPEGDLGTKTPTYHWTAVSGATSYLLKVVDTDSEATLINQTVQTTACDAGTCSITPTTRLTGTNYSFTVTAINSFGQAESSPFSLRVLLPANTTLLAPDSSVQELYPTFKWSVVPVVNSYVIKVMNYMTDTFVMSKTVPASSCDAEACQTTFDEPLDYGLYQFEIAASNDYGQGDFVQSDPFGQYSPSTPIVIAPSDTIYDAKPILKWKAVKGANSYDLKVVNTETNVAVTISGLTSACTSNSCAYTLLSPLSDGYYRFEVVANYLVTKKTEAGTSNFTYLYHTVPAIPVTTDPVGTVYAQKPTFKWTPTARATAYKLMILKNDDSPLLTVTVSSSNCKGTVCSYIPSVIISDGEYRYQVASVNSFGQSAFSTPVPFTQNYRTAPDSVSAVAPTSTVFVQKPIYKWSSTSRASSYLITVVNADTSAIVLNNYTVSSSYCKAGVCSFTQPSVLADGNYAFHVTAKNAFGSSEASADLPFEVDYVSAPAAPVATGPVGIVYAAKPKFTWNASARATGYILHWINLDTSENKSFTILSSACVNNLCAYTSPIVLQDGNYQFEIAAKNAFGQSAFGSTGTFELNSHALSPVPTAIAPNGKVYSAKVPFKWNAADRASSYRLTVIDTISSSVKFNGIVAGSVCIKGNCTYTPAVVFADGDYQFTVSSINANGQSDASSPSDFSVSARTVSATPELIGPTGVTNFSQPTYQWKAAGGATGYTISIINTGTSATVYTSLVPTTACKNNVCSFIPAINLINGNYKFMVAGKNLYGISSYGEMTFTVFGFNSQFTKDTFGWNPRWLNFWKLSGGSYIASGVGYADIYSLQSTSYDDVDYSVRIKRAYGMYLKDGFYSAPANSLLVHAVTNSSGISGGYEFAYYDLGVKGDSVYAIFKYYPDGTRELIQVAETTSIVEQNWNTLRVTVADDTYNFYINDQFLYTFTDSDYSRGLMGVSVGERGNTTATTMYVDWATLSGYTAPEGGFGSVISPEQQALNAVGLELFGNQFDGSQFQSLDQK